MESSELQIWELIIEASLLVQGVMALLVLASIGSWMVIFRKRQMLSKAKKRAHKFEELFWSGADLGKLYDKVASDQANKEGLEAIFQSGFKAFTRLREEQHLNPETLFNGAHRAMRVTLTREIERLENNLSFLACRCKMEPNSSLKLS